MEVRDLRGENRELKAKRGSGKVRVFGFYLFF